MYIIELWACTIGNRVKHYSMCNVAMLFKNRQLHVGCMARARTPIVNMINRPKSRPARNDLQHRDSHIPFVAVDGTGDGSDGLMVMGCELRLSLSSSTPLPVRPYILLS